MLNFTIGPVQASENVRKIGYNQIPYFRTQEFSKVILENEKYIKNFANTTEDSKVIFLTGSGTLAMEGSIINTLNENDKVLIVNGGSFGNRFVELCQIHQIKYDEIKLESGKTLTKSDLEKYEGRNYTAFIVNVHETSTGVLYDMNLISDFCQRNHLFLIVDAISSFLADEFYMDKWHVDVMITSSQKTLACPPGISIIVLSKRALEKMQQIHVRSMYLNFKNALKNAERGQTPFTPAVGILLQINERLREIEKSGGVKAEIHRVKELAKDFREKIKNLPFEIYSDSLSNALTSLHPLKASANDIFNILKDEYGIWVCPNGGELKDKVFRVGHIGYLTEEDNNVLINALNDMCQRKLI